MNQKVFLSVVGGLVVVGVLAVAGLSFIRGERQSDWRTMKAGERMEKRGDRQEARAGQRTSLGRGAGLRDGSGQGRQMNRENCIADECLSVGGLEYPAGVLSDTAKQSLMTALDDEYKAFASYQAVIARLGSVRPFSMIIRAEEQHISSLKALLDKYGVSIPENKYLATVTAPATIQVACQVGVDAEIANVALYRDTLLPTVTAYPDITQVFTNLMTASEERHLPAFDRCN